MKSLSSFTDLTDRDLLDAVKRLVGVERRATAELVASLSEVDARRLYLGEGCSSLFTYCTHVLHLSEHAAYGRIEAARAARRFPVILDMLTDGALTLTSVTLLSAHLTAENHMRVLDAARHKSKREVEIIVAALRPLPDVASVVRKIPARCAERGFLELHHVVPFADGGATDVANLQLRCRAHNAYEAEQWFGPLAVREISPGYEGLGPDLVDWHHSSEGKSVSEFS